MKVTNIGNKIININKDFRILPTEAVEVDDSLYNALSAYEVAGLIKISKKSQKVAEAVAEDEAEDVKADAVEEAPEAPEAPKKGKKK